MCIGCYAQYGKPQIDSVPVRAAAALVKQVCSFFPTGGNLHSILDDWNLEDNHLQRVEDRLPQYRDALVRTNPAQFDAEDTCLAALKALTLEERASALAIHRGYYGP